MSESLVKQLLDSGVHFGHKSSGWNPKMKPFIFGKKNGIHIIDVRQTVRGLLLAKRFITRVVAGGKDVVFVGTKRQAAPAVEAKAKDAGMPYVTERWLGGTLTNFRTIRARLKRLEELETLMASPEWTSYSKKMAAQLTRERKKMDLNLSGIRTMNNLPGVMVVIDVKKEHNAVLEARKLGIPTICIIDTDSDPGLADISIPCNDDAMRAIEIILGELCAAVIEGKTARAQQELERKTTDQAAQPQRRRSSRAMFKAEEAGAAAAEEPKPAAEPAPEQPAASEPAAQ